MNLLTLEITQVYPMSKSSEDLLDKIHGLVGEKIKHFLESDDPRDVREGISMAMKFLKDNNISATIDASPNLEHINSMLPDAEELERLMTLTPD